MRQLSADEAELWARVTASIRPLSRELPTTPPEDAEAPASPVSKALSRAAPSSRQKQPSEQPVAASQMTLDGSWDKRLRSGAQRPDRVVDLHGMNLDRAWHAIDRALEDATASGDRLLLLITGHERKGSIPVERGRIRASVHDWLAASRHASAIAAVRPAHARHGGGGSLYIVLRRPRQTR